MHKKIKLFLDNIGEHNKLSGKMLKILLILFALVLLLYAAAVVFINSLSYSLLENAVKNYTGLKIELITPKTTLSPELNLNFKASEINLYNDDKSIKFISVNNPEITIKPFSLLVKRVNFKKINIKNIQINVKRDANGEIDFIKAFKQKNNFNPKGFIISRMCGRMENVNFIFEDNYITKEKLTISSNDIDVKISKRKDYFKISGEGLIENNKNGIVKKSPFSLNVDTRYSLSNLQNGNINVKISDFDLNILNSIFKKYISSDIEKIEGQLNLSVKTGDNSTYKTDIQIKNPLMLYKNKLTVLSKNDINVSSEFSYNKLLKINYLNITGDNLFLNASGEINKVFSKNPDINIETEVKNTQINNLIYLLPDNLITYRPKGIPVLKNSNFHGIADGKLNIKFSPLNITGNLKVSDIHIPDYPKPSRQNDVNAVFMKDKVRIYTRIYTPDNEYITLDGISNLDNSFWGKYSVKSTPKIDLKFAKMYLVPIQQVIGFNIGPVPNMDITGYGNIDIKTQGTIFDAQIFGEFNAVNATARIEGIDVKLEKGICKLIFDNRNLIFKEVKGKIQDGAFILTGNGNTKGEVSLKAKIDDVSLNSILNISNNSLMTASYTVFTKNIAAASGKTDAEINLKGTVKDYEDPNFLSMLKLTGMLRFKNNKIILNNKLQAKNISGIINFGEYQKGALKLFINGSKADINFESKDSIEKIESEKRMHIKSEIHSDSLEFSDILAEVRKILPAQNVLRQIENLNFISKLNIKSEGMIDILNSDFSNLKHNGYLIGLNSEKSKNIKFNSGIVKFENNRVVFNNPDISVLDGRLKIKGDISKFLSKNPYFNLDIFLENCDLKNVSLSKINLSQTKIKNAHIEIKNDTLKLNPLSVEYQTMPLFIKAVLKDIYKSKILEANFSAILNEATSDAVINRFLTTPVKIKGEVPIKGYFKGKNDDYSIDFTASIPKDSDILYSGANIGDENLKREISGRINVNQNTAELNNIRLIKYISNQNGKINPVTCLKVMGKIIQKENGLIYDNLKISTLSPVNVRVLNLFFKKSILKKGNMECNINLNGSTLMPKASGRAYFQDLDIPLYNTLIDNIKLSLTDDRADGEIFAKNKESDLKIAIKAKNNLQPPYVVENINIISNKLNVFEILDNVPAVSSKTDIDIKQTLSFKPEDIIIKSGNFDFKEVDFNKIKAQNLKGNFDYKDNLFNLKNIVFDIAKGKINANGKYNLKSTELKIKAKMEDCDSNTLTEEFLQMKGQLYGKINGSVNLEAKNITDAQSFKNIKSNVIFSVNNGRMPKLGSLEYLLRAGNMLKNGVFGISLNNIIQILTPYKAGEFETIAGSVSINKGEVEKLEVTSKSKNLSIYLEGTYDILDTFADIRIYGKLASGVSNALGAIGNASMGQLINSITSKNKQTDEKLKEQLNKIPPIEVENPEPKYFKVKVLGDINKDNYIKSFSWI